MTGSEFADTLRQAAVVLSALANIVEKRLGALALQAALAATPMGLC